MYKILASLMVAATSLVTPVEAGIHDFTPSRVQPARTTTTTTIAGEGNCFSTQDNSRYCFLSTGKGRYIVAINDTDYPSYPASMMINCQTGKWYAYSKFPQSQLALWARVFCRQNS